jgi:hypothetical protein
MQRAHVLVFPRDAPASAYTERFSHAIHAAQQKPGYPTPLRTRRYMDIGAGEVTTFHAESMAGDVCSKHDL